MGARLLLASCMVVTALTLASCSAFPFQNTTTAHPTLDDAFLAANFSRLELGMTEKQVQSILGPETKWMTMSGSWNVAFWYSNKATAEVYYACKLPLTLFPGSFSVQVVGMAYHVGRIEGPFLPPPSRSADIDGKGYDLPLCKAFHEISLGMTPEEVEGVLGRNDKTTIRNAETNELALTWSKQHTMVYAAFEIDNDLLAKTGNRVNRLHDKALMADDHFLTPVSIHEREE